MVNSANSFSGDLLSINTGIADEVARSIEDLASGGSEFEKVTKEVKNLEEYWCSPAAALTFSKFEKVKAIVENRNQTLLNCAAFLRTCISGGYVQVEEANKELADAFL